MSRVTQVPITVNFPEDAPPCCCGSIVGCTCAALPETLYARLTKYQWVAGDGVVAIESVTWDLTLEKGCPSAPALPCGNGCIAGRTWFNESFQERGQHACNGIPYEKYMMDAVLTLQCAEAGGGVRLSACNSWKQLVTCPATYSWLYPTATPTVEPAVITCKDGELYAVYDRPAVVNIGPIRKLEISSSPFV